MVNQSTENVGKALFSFIYSFKNRINILAPLTIVLTLCFSQSAYSLVILPPGTNNNTEIQSLTQWKLDSALEFDGKDSRTELGAVDISGSEMSIAFWFNANDFGTSDARFISKATGTSGRDHYWMVSTINKTKLRFRLKTNGKTTTLISPAGIISTDKWHHVAVTYDGNEMKIYRDGDLVANTVKTGDIDTNDSVQVAIGNQPSGAGSKPFDGLIDNILFYSQALTVDQIEQIMSGATEVEATPSLISHWTLDESNGSTAVDSIGSHLGTLVNGPIWQSTKGQIGGALEFDGENDRVDLGAVNISGKALTIALWMKADDFDISDGRLISKATGTSADSHYWMVSTINKTKLRFRLKTNGKTTTLITKGNVISDNQWHHVTATYDGTKMRLYRDGNIVASTSKTGDIDTNDSVLAAIGNQPNGAGSKPFDGLIDDIRLYKIALNADEVQSLISANNNNGTSTPDTGGDTGTPDTGGDTGTPDNGGDTGTPDTGGDTGTPDNGGDTGTPDTGGDTGTPDNGGDTGTPDNGGDTNPPSVAACSDGLDNDNDSLVDYPNDPGCASVNDTDEVDIPTNQIWTSFTPSIDTQIVYISNSVGDDATCAAYAASLSSNPFNPAPSLTPCKSIDAAVNIYNNLPNNEPHWILFKSGDTWTNQNFGKWEKSGRSVNEPAVLASYGTSTQRPKVLTGTSSFSGAVSSGVKFVTIADLFIQSHTYTSTDGKGGPRAFRWISGQPANDWVFEGLHVQDYATAFLIGSSQAPYRGSITNLTFRNNTVNGNQGENAIYISGVNGLKLFEGNTFYDNAYYANHTDGHYRGKHIYLDNENGYPPVDPTGHAVFRDNFFIDSAAYTFQSRIGGEIYNNYIEDHGTGIGVGAHDNGQLWPIVTTSIHNNVVMHLGDSLDQVLGYGISIENSDANIQRNIIAYYNSAKDFGHPFYVTGDGGNTALTWISNNTVYDVEGDVRVGSGKGGSQAPVGFADNFINDDMNLNSTDIRSSTVNFVDADLRDIAKYNRDILGGANSRDAFMTEALKQWRGYYRFSYTAPAVNDYIRRGFEPDGSQPQVCGKGAVPCGFGTP